jgi:hypothetical protein
MVQFALQELALQECEDLVSDDLIAKGSMMALVEEELAMANLMLLS